MKNSKKPSTTKPYLVSISAVNNEIGTIQPIKEAVDIVKDKNPQTLFHTDASDAYGRIPFNVQDLKVDIATVSSYKIQGPRGIGALYLREGVNMERILEGQIGTQKLWPGIENTPLIVGFTKASELAFENFEANTNKNANTCATSLLTAYSMNSLTCALTVQKATNAAQTTPT